MMKAVIGIASQCRVGDIFAKVLRLDLGSGMLAKDAVFSAQPQNTPS
jgi:hypothetical protein